MGMIRYGTEYDNESCFEIKSFVIFGLERWAWTLDWTVAVRPGFDEFHSIWRSSRLPARSHHNLALFCESSTAAGPGVKPSPFDESPVLKHGSEALLRSAVWNRTLVFLMCWVVAGWEPLSSAVEWFGSGSGRWQLDAFIWLHRLLTLRLSRTENARYPG